MKQKRVSIFTFKPVKINSKPVKFKPIFKRAKSKPAFGFGLKKDMNWKQAKKAYPKLKPFGDIDKDGVRNKFDCKPFDKKRQHRKGSMMHGWAQEQSSYNEPVSYNEPEPASRSEEHTSELQSLS